jgi:hypothetical protein
LTGRDSLGRLFTVDILRIEPKHWLSRVLFISTTQVMRYRKGYDILSLLLPCMLSECLSNLYSKIWKSTLTSVCSTSPARPFDFITSSSIAATANEVGRGVRQSHTAIEQHCVVRNKIRHALTSMDLKNSCISAPFRDPTAAALANFKILLARRSDDLHHAQVSTTLPLR